MAEEHLSVLDAARALRITPRQLLAAVRTGVLPMPADHAGRPSRDIGSSAGYSAEWLAQARRVAASGRLSEIPYPLVISVPNADGTQASWLRQDVFDHALEASKVG